MRYYCKCGCYFGKSQWRAEHVGICNPTWPRTSPDDEHAAVTEQEWNDRRNRQYASLKNS
jgi:hypothetical protein